GRRLRRLPDSRRRPGLPDPAPALTGVPPGMPESAAAKRARARAIMARLEKAYPDATIALRFETPLQLLVATILAAQCTDERVNQVTPGLFGAYRTAADFAG